MLAYRTYRLAKPKDYLIRLVSTGNCQAFWASRHCYLRPVSLQEDPQMKKLLVLAAVLIMAALPLMAQTSSAYMVDYFSNNPGPGGAADQQLRLVNVGVYGTPLTSPVGDVCANVYVFDANQEMVACCSCRITPNGLLTLSVANGLTNNPVTSVVPVNGAIKIIPTLAAGVCSPLTYNGGVAPSLVGWASHIETSGGTAPGT